MSKFISVKTGEVYKGKFPSKIELPIHKNEPFPHSISKITTESDSDWEEDLERYMWFEGYVKV